jgi:hypothetical protein
MTLVGLPRDERQELLDAMDALGGRKGWGILELAPGLIYAHPGELVEQLLPRTLDMLNKLLAETPVERLGVTLTPEDMAPSDKSPFDARTRQHIRWQLGL